MAAQRSLMYRPLESARRLEQSRAARWIARARDFAPRTALQLNSLVAPLCRTHCPVEPRESASVALASNQTAAQATWLVAVLVPVSGA
jgi:hypothetical protein